MKNYSLTIFICLSLTQLLSQNVKAKFFLSDMSRLELLNDSDQKTIKNEIDNIYKELEKTVVEKYSGKIEFTERETTGSDFDQDGYTSALLSLNNPTQMEADYLRAQFTRNYSKKVKKEKARKFDIENRVLIKWNRDTETYESYKDVRYAIKGYELDYRIPEWSEIVKYVGGYTKLAESNLKKSDTSKFAIRTVLEDIEIVDETNWKGTVKVLGNEEYGLKYYQITEPTFTIIGTHQLPMLSIDKFVAEQLGVRKNNYEGAFTRYDWKVSDDWKNKAYKTKYGWVNGVEYGFEDRGRFSVSSVFALNDESDKSRIYVKFDLIEQELIPGKVFYVALTTIIPELDELFESYFNTSELIIGDVVNDKEFDRIVPQEYWNSDDWINKAYKTKYGNDYFSSGIPHRLTKYYKYPNWEIKPADINWLINRKYNGLQFAYSGTKDGLLLYETLYEKLEDELWELLRSNQRLKEFNNGVTAIKDTLIVLSYTPTSEIEDYFKDELSPYLVGRKKLNEIFFQRLSDLGYEESVIKLMPNADLLKTLYVNEVVVQEQNKIKLEIIGKLKDKLKQERKNYYLNKLPFLVHKEIIINILSKKKKGLKKLNENVLEYYENLLSDGNYEPSDNSSYINLYSPNPTTIFHHVSNLEFHKKYLSNTNIHWDVINQTVESLVDEGFLLLKRKKHLLNNLDLQKSDLLIDWQNIIYPDDIKLDDFEYIEPSNIELINKIANYHYEQNNYNKAIQLYETMIANLDNIDSAEKILEEALLRNEYQKYLEKVRFKQND